MEWFIALALIIVASFIGFLIGKSSSPEQEKLNEMEALILEKDSELESLKQQVTEHFETSAQLFSQVSTSYQSLCEHMANNAIKLSGDSHFKLEDQHTPTPALEKSEGQQQDSFSNESLYNAHEYRNQEEPEAAPPTTQSDKPSADIIPLERKDNSQQPLDYAIKNKPEAAASGNEERKES